MLGNKDTSLQKQTKQTTLSFGTPPTKRRKVSPPIESVPFVDIRAKSRPETPQAAYTDLNQGGRRAQFLPQQSERVIPDSDADNDEDLEGLQTETQQTDLEQALPPIQTDREAIEAYEAMRRGDDTERAQRIDNGEWVKGKSSIYVDAFNLALDTVLEEESHLFDASERKLFDDWKMLDYEYQYLSVAAVRLAAF